MQAYRDRVSRLIRKPSAYLPIAMSLSALALTATAVMLHGAAREADEGTAAHVFQLLIAAQVPIVAFFAIRWGAKDSAAAASVLALQALALGLALLPVWALGL